MRKDDVFSLFLLVYLQIRSLSDCSARLRAQTRVIETFGVVVVLQPFSLL